MHRLIDSASPNRQHAAPTRHDAVTSGQVAADEFRSRLQAAADSKDAQDSDEAAPRRVSGATPESTQVASAVVTRRTGALAALNGSTSRARAVTTACVQEQKRSSTHSLATQEAESSLSAPTQPVAPVTPLAEPAASDQSPRKPQGEKALTSAMQGAEPARAGEETPQATRASQATSFDAARQADASSPSGGEPTHEGSAPQASPAERVRTAAGSTSSISRTVTSAGVGATPVGQTASVSRAISRETLPVGGLSPMSRGQASRQISSEAPKARFAMPRPAAEEPTMMLRTGKALAAALKGEGDLKLNLSPEELGRVQVRMACDQEGMSIRLTCERPESATTLESGKASLKRSLEEQGVRVKEIEVRMSGAESDAAGTSSRDASTSAGDEQSAPGHGQEETPRDIPAHANASMRPRLGGDDELDDLVEVPASLGTALATVGAEGVSGAIDTVV